MSTDNNKSVMFAGFNPCAQEREEQLIKLAKEVAAYETAVKPLHDAGMDVPDAMMQALQTARIRLENLSSEASSGEFNLTHEFSCEVVGEGTPVMLGFGFSHIPADKGADHKFVSYVLTHMDEDETPQILASSQEFTGVRSGNREANAWLSGVRSMVDKFGLDIGFDVLATKTYAPAK